ncbi:hypothetical protein NQ318_009888 [Aromia moschata]|uniref:Protein arginine N-methyltransferase domain-containing protein n=1 Tax=Aromia moschata TaxID=1265417 RepID=A0AAV8Y3I5_9CUCU|nr:hypothetical protein NQ318_009888 [Aromia moschata]
MAWSAERPGLALFIIILATITLLPLITATALMPIVFLLDLSNFVATKEMASRVPNLHQKQKKLNSLYYLKKAKQACSENSYAEAYEYFVNYFESLNDPSQSSETVQAAFTKLVCKIGTVLEETDNIEELLKCYLQAINLFPNNYIILNNLGAYMFKVGETDIAKRYLELAVKVNKDYLPAEKNLLHVKWHQIPRWHFRMLNDRHRNAAYDRAISESISKGYHNVVDIGAGCGLLSLFASRNSLASVVAIEENKTLHKMCLDILKENDVPSVQCLNVYSTDLPGVPCKCNLLVTETFDVALFGERALESIFHAATVLRTEDDYKIIPCGAKLYIAVVPDKQFALNVLIDRSPILSDPGFSAAIKWDHPFLSRINSEQLANKCWYLHNDALSILSLDTLCIRQRESEPYEAEYLTETNFEFMTDSQQVFHINFYNREQILSILMEDDYYEIIHLKCKRGVIHAFTIWFDLNLTEEVSITTNPLDPDCIRCWEQAVFYLNRPVLKEEGDTLAVKVTVADCKLKLTVVEDDFTQRECVLVSKEIVSFLNDRTLVQSIVNVADELAHHQNLLVIDYNVFPLFGLLMAKTTDSTVYHSVSNDADVEFLKHILTLNNIPSERFTILDGKTSLVSNSRASQTAVYFFDPINTDGSLNSAAYRDQNIAHTTIIPQMVTVKVQLIYSAYIDHCNKVEDENVLGFKIGKYMNEYMGNEHPNLEKLDYVEFSSPVAFSLEEDEKSCEVIVFRTGLVNSLYFWYDLQLHENITFSTLTSSHYKKCCFFLETSRSVKSGDTYRITMKCEGHYLKLSLQ